jgi:hypothetical protein
MSASMSASSGWWWVLWQALAKLPLRTLSVGLANEAH